MNRLFLIVAAALGVAASTLQAAPADTDRGANFVRFNNLTDDSCQVFLNDVYRGVAPPAQDSEWFAVGRDNIKPLNIAVRCADGGNYAMQLEAIKDRCTVTFDEEGNGIHAKCTEQGVDGTGDDDRGVIWVNVRSVLDDRCGVWINGALRARLDGLSETGWIQAQQDNVPRTNVLIRCHDGGVYGTSIESIYNKCLFEVDEEGGGLRTVECN